MLSIYKFLSNMDDRLEVGRAIKNLKIEVMEKQNAAEVALAAAEKANLQAEEAVKRLEEALKQQSDEDAAVVTQFESAEQKIARLEKELADVRRISQLEKEIEAVNASNSKSLEDVQVEVVEQTATTTTKEVLVATPKVAAEKLNVVEAPKASTVKVIETIVPEPEAPSSGAKGAAARRK